MTHPRGRLSRRFAAVVGFLRWELGSYRAYLDRARRIRQACGVDVFVHPDSEITGEVMIGDHTNINGPAFITAGRESSVSIGKWCAIGHNLRIRTDDHFTEFANVQAKLQERHGFARVWGKSKGQVIVENAAWIGDNVIILPGARVGDGCVVGAGSVVTKHLPSFSICAGVPASVIKYRFPEHVREFLLDVRWWDWDEGKIGRNAELFNADLTITDPWSIQIVE